jgi:hypothetical protein
LKLGDKSRDAVISDGRALGGLAELALGAPLSGGIAAFG